MITEKETKALICYQSKYGSTEQYAKWIQNEIGCDIYNVKEKNQPNFQGYDIIIFGGYLRMGKIKIAPFIIDNWNKIKDKKIILFTASGLPAEDPNLKEMYEHCFPDYIRQKIKYFPLRGRLIFRKLTMFDKLLILVGSKFERDERVKKAMQQDLDGVRRDNLMALFNYLKENYNNK